MHDRHASHLQLPDGRGGGPDLRHRFADRARGLESVDYVPGRLERIECGQPFSVFVDFAHTPEALASVLRHLRQVTAGRLICVFGAGGDRDRQKRPLMGAAVEAGPIGPSSPATTRAAKTPKPSSTISWTASRIRPPPTVVDRVAAIHAASARPGRAIAC